MVVKPTSHVGSSVAGSGTLNDSQRSNFSKFTTAAKRKVSSSIATAAVFTPMKAGYTAFNAVKAKKPVISSVAPSTTASVTGSPKGFLTSTFKSSVGAALSSAAALKTADAAPRPLSQDPIVKAKARLAELFVKYKEHSDIEAEAFVYFMTVAKPYTQARDAAKADAEKKHTGTLQVIDKEYNTAIVGASPAQAAALLTTRNTKTSTARDTFNAEINAANEAYDAAVSSNPVVAAARDAHLALAYDKQFLADHAELKALQTNLGSHMMRTDRTPIPGDAVTVQDSVNLVYADRPQEARVINKAYSIIAAEQTLSTHITNSSATQNRKFSEADAVYKQKLDAAQATYQNNRDYTALSNAQNAAYAEKNAAVTAAVDEKGRADIAALNERDAAIAAIEAQYGA